MVWFSDAIPKPGILVQKHPIDYIGKILNIYTMLSNLHKECSPFCARTGKVGHLRKGKNPHFPNQSFLNFVTGNTS